MYCDRFVSGDYGYWCDSFSLIIGKLFCNRFCCNTDAYGFDRTYRITSVRLGMVTIPEQNGEGGLTVPCWDFMGNIWAEEEFPESWKQTGMMQDGSFSYLTINAIDGSIIQRGH